jgi:tetratricopeptide (TPR) repeat protein
MDCRRCLVLAPCLLGGVLGCFGQGAVPVVPENTPVEVTPEKDLPRRKPTAATCAALGAYREGQANETNCSPADQQRLRDQARTAYQQAIDLDPKYVAAFDGMARVYDVQGDHGRAITTYRKGLQVNPKEGALWYDLGMCHCRHGEWEPGLEAMRKALELDPDNRQFATTLGFSLARAGLYDESVACFAKVVGPPSAHYNVARMLHHLRQDELSKQHLRLALQLNPGLTPARQLLTALESGTAAPADAAVPPGFANQGGMAPSR